MKHKLVKAPNTTISNIKSFRFIEQVNEIGAVRWGSCISSCIEVEVYGSYSDAVPTGTILEYYQTVDRSATLAPTQTETDILIGKFTTITSATSKNTYSFVAYDNIYRLNKNLPTYSTHKTYLSIFSDIATLCGVSFDYTGVYDNLLEGYIDVFRSSNMTCRDFVSQFAEANGRFVRCKSDGTIEFAKFSDASRGYWNNASSYFIGWTDDITAYSSPYSSKTPVVYKQNGIRFAEKNTTCYGSGEILDSSPDYYGDVMWDVHKTGVYANYPVYQLGNNVVVDYFESFYDDDDSHWEDLLWEIIDSNESYRECDIQLFPFLNPFRAGQRISVVTNNHASFDTYIMKMEVNDSEAIITCGGRNSELVSAIDNSSTEQTEAVTLAKINTLAAQISALSGTIDTALYYQNGDTIDVGGYVPLAAYVTSSTKVLRIGVPVTKSLSNITSVRVDSIVGGCRGISGNLNSLSGDSNDFSQIGTVTADIASDNMVVVTVTSTNAYTNVSNNTPLVFSANSITLTFIGSSNNRSEVFAEQDDNTGSLYIS